MNGPVGKFSFRIAKSFEPEAFRVQGRRSTGLSYGPVNVNPVYLHKQASEYEKKEALKKKGGDPAVGSPTATL